MNRVLVIEEDRKVREILSARLFDLGYTAEAASDSDTGLSLAQERNYALLIINANIGGTGGLDICKAVRQENEGIPIMMLSHSSTALDRIIGLEVGADDYLASPFDIEEFAARVRALLRRANQHARSKSHADKKLVCGNLIIDCTRRTVEREGSPVEISVTEFEILSRLAAQPGRVFSRRELLIAVWGEVTGAYEQNVTAHINRLRRKLEPDLQNPRYLKTVRGIGYRFAETLNGLCLA